MRKVVSSITRKGRMILRPDNEDEKAMKPREDPMGKSNWVFTVLMISRIRAVQHRNGQNVGHHHQSFAPLPQLFFTPTRAGLEPLEATPR